MHADFRPLWIRSAPSSIFLVQHLHPLFLFFTGLGTSGVLGLCFCSITGSSIPVFARRLSIVFAASILANRIFKELFGTARPSQDVPLLSTPSAERTALGHGFPSGHSQNAATFWLALAFRYRRRGSGSSRGCSSCWSGCRGSTSACICRRTWAAASSWAPSSPGRRGWTGPRGWRPSWDVLTGVVTLVLPSPSGRSRAPAASSPARRRQAGVHAAADGRRPDRDRAGRRRRPGAHRGPALLAAGEALSRPGDLAGAGLSSLSGGVRRGFGLWPRLWQILTPRAQES